MLVLATIITSSMPPSIPRHANETPSLSSLPGLQWVRLLGVEEAAEVMDALREERVVMVPGRICHPRAADPTFKSVTFKSWPARCCSSAAWTCPSHVLLSNSSAE